MKRLIATPMPRHYYLASFLLRGWYCWWWKSAWWWASVRWCWRALRGSFLDLALLCVLGSLSFSALGLLIASRAEPSKPLRV